LVDPDQSGSMNNFHQLFNADKEFGSYQLKALFSIKQHTGDLSFEKNNFEGCMSYKGLLDVELVDSSSIISLKGNTFS
jgi:hypothetical protein